MGYSLWKGTKVNGFPQQYLIPSGTDITLPGIMLYGKFSVLLKFAINQTAQSLHLDLWKYICLERKTKTNSSKPI